MTPDSNRPETLLAVSSEIEAAAIVAALTDYTSPPAPWKAPTPNKKGLAPIDVSPYAESAEDRT